MAISIEKPVAPAEEAGRGMELAYQANEAFAAWQREQTEETKQLFHSLVKTAEKAIGIGAPGANELQPVPKTPELLEKKIAQTKQALAKKYEHQGLKPEHFEVVQIGDRLVVAYTGSDGIDLSFSAVNTSSNPASKRTWDVITASNSSPRFMVEVDGIEHDARAGMTLELQQKLIEQGKVEYNQEGYPRTKIWLTGEEPADAHYAPVAGQVVEHEGERTALRSFAHRFYADTLVMCFRPAVIITERLSVYGMTDYTAERVNSS